MKTRCWFAALAMFAACSAGSALAEETSVRVSLGEALRRGLVEVSISGRNACAGDSVEVVVQRKTGAKVEVFVESGAVVKHTAQKVQDMTCHQVKYEKIEQGYRRADVMVLADDAKRTFLLEAYCRDFAKPTPKADTALELERAGGDAFQALILQKGHEFQADIRTLQSAIWIASGVQDEELRSGFHATEQELAAARVLVESAKLTQQAQVAPLAEKPSAEVLVQVQTQVQDALKKLWEARENAPFRRGDKVVVTVEQTAIRGPLGRVLHSVNKGDELTVDGVLGNRLHVNVRGGRDGWIPTAVVALRADTPRGRGRPILREIGQIIAEADLDVAVKVD